MAWNQSSSNYSKKPASGSKKLSPAVKGVLALIVVWALGSLVWWFIAANDVEQPVVKQPQEPKILEEVQAAKAGEAKSSGDQIVRKEFHYWEVDSTQTNGYSEAQIRKWKALRRPSPGITNDTSRVELPPKFAVFNHPSENEIACLLTLKIGEGLVGEGMYDDQFRMDFEQSLKDPILIGLDDDAETQELKRAMVETKQELKARVDAGEDICEIMSRAREEHQNLAAYKSMIEDAFREMVEGESSNETSFDDCLEAANKMLDEKGIAPIKLSPIARRLMMKRLKFQH